MKGGRWSAAIVGAFSAFLLVRGVLAVLAVKTVSDLSIGQPTPPSEAQLQQIADLEQNLTYLSAGFLLFGVAAAACAVGLFRRKEWARRSWLVLGVVLLGIIAVLIFNYPQQWMPYVIDGLIVAASLIVLTTGSKHEGVA
jgi:peptidoglycan/LPS O-acetylase OafA/YrhL